jgi:hypothetical protein
MLYSSLDCSNEPMADETFPLAFFCCPTRPGTLDGIKLSSVYRSFPPDGTDNKNKTKERKKERVKCLFGRSDDIDIVFCYKFVAPHSPAALCNKQVSGVCFFPDHDIPLYTCRRRKQGVYVHAG